MRLFSKGGRQRKVPYSRQSVEERPGIDERGGSSCDEVQRAICAGDELLVDLTVKVPVTPGHFVVWHDAETYLVRDHHDVAGVIDCRSHGACRPFVDRYFVEISPHQVRSPQREAIDDDEARSGASDGIRKVEFR